MRARPFLSLFTISATVPANPVVVFEGEVNIAVGQKFGIECFTTELPSNFVIDMTTFDKNKSISKATVVLTFEGLKYRVKSVDEKKTEPIPYVPLTGSNGKPHILLSQVEHDGLIFFGGNGNAYTTVKALAGSDHIASVMIESLRDIEGCAPFTLCRME